MIAESGTRKKRSTGGKAKDSDSLLVILEAVLQTHRSSPTDTCASSTRRSQSLPNGTVIANSTTSSQRLCSSGTKDHADIDGKIEKAMDSVKTQLLLTVRKEVHYLQSQVALLQLHNAQLEQENRILRQSAAPELLARLDRRDATLTASSA